MKARWNRVFALLLAMSLISAGASVAVVAHLAGQFASTADRVEQATAVTGALRLTVSSESASALELVDFGAAAAEPFRTLDRRTEQLFVRASRILTSARQTSLVRRARVLWNQTYAQFRPVANDPERAAAYADEHQRDRAAAIQLHAELSDGQTRLDALLGQVDATFRAAARAQLSSTRSAERGLIAALTAMFVISAVATVIFARRMTLQVLAPIENLSTAAERFGGGDLDHRVQIDQPDELGELGTRFNEMADSLSGSQWDLTMRATHDPLTGLLNRVGLWGPVREQLADPTSGLEPLTVMFVDLDDFKFVNDSLGHDAGDEVLRQVADRLQSAVRTGDVVARLGGDEFAVLLRRPASYDDALLVAERVLDAFDDPARIGGSPVDVGASIGIARERSGVDGIDELFHKADIAMYGAKGRGKGRAEMYDPETHGLAEERRVRARAARHSD